MITINSLNQLLQDGEDLGAVFDAVANHHLYLPDVQRAMIAFLDGIEARHAAELAAVTRQPDPLPQPQPTPVITIKAWQAKFILRGAGLLDDAIAAIDGMDEGEEKMKIQEAWNGNADFPRSASILDKFKVTLNLTDTQLDGMFAAASQLTF